MTNEQRAALKKTCGSFLKANDMKLGTKTAAKFIHSFWYGALAALDDTTNPWVTICLMSGRHDELVDMS